MGAMKVLLLLLLTFSANANDCMGPDNAKSFAVYLHGIDSQKPSDQEKTNRKILSSIATKLKMKFALPRASEKCGPSICWGWALTDKDAKSAIGAIEAAANKCFPKSSNYGLVGFSSGGYMATKLFRSCTTPRKVSWIVTSGSTMMKGPIEPEPKDLSQCGKLSMLVGTKDEGNRDPKKNYLNLLLAKKARATYEEFDGSHELNENTLEQMFIKLNDK